MIDLTIFGFQMSQKQGNIVMKITIATEEWSKASKGEQSSKRSAALAKVPVEKAGVPQMVFAKFVPKNQVNIKIC